MKIIIAFLFSLVIANNAQGQESRSTGDKIYIYKTYNDFKNDSGEYLGEYAGTSSGPLHKKLIYIIDGKKKRKIINDDWGFKIGEYFFRFKKGRWFRPMFIVKEKGKIFYFNGELFLSSLLWGSENGVLSTGRDLVMYSDTYESKFKKIEKLVKEEKDNPLFKELIPCIEKGLERYGVAPKFKSLSKCINEF